MSLLVCLDINGSATARVWLVGNPAVGVREWSHGDRARIAPNRASNIESGVDWAHQKFDDAGNAALEFSVSTSRMFDSDADAFEYCLRHCYELAVNQAIPWKADVILRYLKAAGEWAEYRIPGALITLSPMAPSGRTLALDYTFKGAYVVPNGAGRTLPLLVSVPGWSPPVLNVRFPVAHSWAAGISDGTVLNAWAGPAVPQNRTRITVYALLPGSATKQVIFERFLIATATVDGVSQGVGPPNPGGTNGTVTQRLESFAASQPGQRLANIAGGVTFTPTDMVTVATVTVSGVTSLKFTWVGVPAEFGDPVFAADYNVDGVSLNIEVAEQTSGGADVGTPYQAQVSGLALALALKPLRIDGAVVHVTEAL